jgi:hypothetical protein
MTRSGADESSDLFRAVNERILELGAPAIGAADLICECVDAACTRVMRMTLEEYNAVRSDPTIHAVMPGHEQLGLEEIVDQTARYVLVRVLDAATVPEVAV